jgi:hypothetical protein
MAAMGRKPYVRFHPHRPSRIRPVAVVPPFSDNDAMQAQLRSLTTADGEPLEAVRTSEVAFSISLRAMIGPAGSKGEESFDFEVCSPAWLTAELQRWPLITGRFFLIANRFDPKEIESYVRKRIAQASGDDWGTIAEKIARWSAWEFEDYRE